MHIFYQFYISKYSSTVLYYLESIENLIQLWDVWDMMQSNNQTKHVVHAYLKDTPVSGYMKCTLCKNRTGLVCVKCRYCYCCHCELLSEQLLSKDNDGKERLLMHMLDK